MAFLLTVARHSSKRRLPLFDYQTERSGAAMKHLPWILVLVLALMACNLSSKLRGNSNSSTSPSSSSGNPSKIGHAPGEKPNPTAEQSAIIANGQDVKWDKQGISWKIPANWKKQSVSTNSFQYAG